MSLRPADKNIPAALVTGACSGIGRAIAEELAGLGYELVLVSHRPKELEQTARAFEQKYRVKTHVIVSNLARAEAARELHDEVLRRNIDVGILVNNAGFFFFGEVADADPLRAEALLQLHVVTPSLLCTLFGTSFRAQRRGYILNVASISAWGDMPGIAYYASSKKYLLGFTKALRMELEVYGVHVTCLVPGATATGLYDPKMVDVRMAQRVGMMLPAEEVARAGLEALFRGDEMCIPGRLSKAFAWLFEHTPKSIVRVVRVRAPWLRPKQ